MQSSLTNCEVQNPVQYNRQVVFFFSSYPMSPLTNPELHQLWKQNAGVPSPISTAVQDLIIQRAAEQSNRQAIIAWDGEFNYGQLICLASNLSHYLSQHACRHHGKVLPILMSKSKWMPIAMVGALLGGWGIAPLDIQTPTARLTEILDILDPPCLLTTSEATIEVDTAVPLIPVDDLDLDDESFSGPWQPAKKVPVKVAAVVFTSGSTGSPKGVMLGPECISTTAVYGSRILRLDQSTRLFQFSSFSFDISLHEIFMTLVAGGCLCIPSEMERLNSPIASINLMQANYLCTTPSVMMSVLAEAVTSTSIKVVVLAGEALTSRIRPFLDMGLCLFNWYGSSECPIVSLESLDKGTWLPSQLSPQHPGNCWVVRPEDPNVLCGLGEVGEVLVESPMMTLGYLNAPQQTEAVFAVDPTWLINGHGCVSGRRGRLYRTGDLVRSNQDYTFEFIGRKDTMVKVRGQRVELSEVEFRIWDYLRSRNLGSPLGVLEVLVEPIGFNEGGDNVDICCFLYVHGELNLPQSSLAKSATIPYINMYTPGLSIQGLQSELDHSLREALPAYMIPSLYFQLSEVPFTPSGKVDRRLLRSLALQISHHDRLSCHIHPQESLVLPENDIEFALRRLWANLLGVEADIIHANMSFLRCGGDSLRAISLSKALLANFNLVVKVPELLRQETTIQYLASQLVKHSNGLAVDQPRMDIATLLEAWVANLKTVSIQFPTADPFCNQGSQVLLTGATGYLGTHILGELFRSRLIGKVIVLVRAADMDTAKERIREVAVAAGWWQKNAFCRIEVWIGNLTEPRLGLRVEEWEQLSTIDTIIHNGAVVNYSASYDSLEKANVISTFYLLEAVLQSRYLRTFIFLSGGIKQGQYESDAEYMRTINESEGYTQTKYLSERLTVTASKLYDEAVQSYSTGEDETRSTNSSRAFIVIKPGYIIGDGVTGLSNTDDFIWKLVAGAVSMGSFPSDPPDHWLEIAEVTYIAKHVAYRAQLGASDNSSLATLPSPGLDDAPGNGAMNPALIFDNINRGLPVQQFWQAIQSQTEVSLKEMDWHSWINEAGVGLERDKEAHPLWSIQLFLRPNIGDKRRAKEDFGSSSGVSVSSEVEAAVQRCVEYLYNIHFLVPQSDGAVLNSSQSNVKDLGRGVNDCLANNDDQVIKKRDMGTMGSNSHFPIISRSKLTCWG